MCRRIFEQMNHYPLDILGNYGMQYAKYNPETGDIDIIRNAQLPCDRESGEKRGTAMREKYGFTEFAGDNVEYHASGCVTFPILGTKAALPDKLAFDPDRSKRRKIYADIKSVFSDYIVFVGGSSSFDMAPAPYDKAYALDLYCKEHGIAHDEVVFVGDDYGYTDRCVINTFNGKLHGYIHKKYGKKYRQHVYYPPAYMGEYDEEPYNYAYCSCMFRSVKKDYDWMKARGVQPWAGASVKNAETVDQAIADGAVLITCNNPDVILQLLRERGKHK